LNAKGRSSVIIRVNDITDRVRRLEALEEIADYPVLKAMQDNGECLFLSPLSLDISVVREYDHIRLEGSVATEVKLNCSRCLAPFESDLRSSFTIFYSQADGVDVQDEEVELGERELVSAYFNGDQIDVSPEISDHVVVELPLKPLCSHNCQGLCMTCGADLNTSQCNCSSNGGSLAFSALKNFKPQR
jgi:uncharacterized protein